MLDFDVRGQQRMEFFTGVSIIMDSFFGIVLWKLKGLIYLFITNMHWSVDYLWIIVTFLSAVWILILTAPIHCRGSISEQVMQC